MKSLFDMKTVSKLQYSLLLLGMMLTVSCSTDEVSDDIADYFSHDQSKLKEEKSKLIAAGMGILEGCWYLDNGSVKNIGWTVRGSITIKEDTISFVLPEEMLIELFWLGCASYPDVTWADAYPDEPFFSDLNSITYSYQLDSLYGQWVCSKTVQQLEYNLEGVTLDAYYMIGSNANVYLSDDDFYGERANIPLPEYGEYSYMISKEDIKYRIDLKINNERLLFDRTMLTWTLQLPIKRIALSNLQTGNQVAVEFEDYARIFMNASSKIE